MEPYFARGEMARPPKLIGNIPTVRADWQWGGSAWVTTDAVLTGAWHLPGENRLVLILANVSDEAVSAGVDIRTWALRTRSVKMCRYARSPPKVPAPTRQPVHSHTISPFRSHRDGLGGQSALALVRRTYWKPLRP